MSDGFSIHDRNKRYTDGLKKINSEDSVEDWIRQFILFMDVFGDEELVCRGGLISSPGCMSDYGCCSKTFDLQAFSETLEEVFGGRNEKG